MRLEWRRLVEPAAWGEWVDPQTAHMFQVSLAMLVQVIAGVALVILALALVHVFRYVAG